MRVALLDRPKFHNLLGATNIVVEYQQGLDCRRLVAMHWVDGLGAGDWIRWNPTIREKDGGPAIRHYLVLANVPHPGRAHEGVMQAVLVAPVPDVTVAGVTYWGPRGLPPEPDILEELKIFRRV